MNSVSQQCNQENEQSEAGKGKEDSLPTMLARKQQWDAANPVTKACHNNLNLWMYLVFTVHFCYHLLWRHFVQIVRKGLEVLAVGFPPKGSCAWLWSHLLALWVCETERETVRWLAGGSNDWGVMPVPILLWRKAILGSSGAGASSQGAQEASLLPLPQKHPLLFSGSLGSAGQAAGTHHPSLSPFLPCAGDCALHFPAVLLILPRLLVAAQARFEKVTTPRVFFRILPPIPFYHPCVISMSPTARCSPHLPQPHWESQSPPRNLALLGWEQLHALCILLSFPFLNLAVTLAKKEKKKKFNLKRALCW